MRMTALENLEVALFHRDFPKLAAELLLPRRGRAIKAARAAECRAVLRRFGLEADADTAAGNLPYGKQKLLEIARALVTRAQGPDARRARRRAQPRRIGGAAPAAAASCAGRIG